MDNEAKIISIEDLYQFMKKNYVIRCKAGDIELELSPIAFHKEVIDEVTEEKEDEYGKFVYPDKKELGEEDL